MAAMKLITLASTLLLATVAAAPVLAQSKKQGTLTITGAWARPTPPGLTVTAVYFTIKNSGKNPDKLIGYSSSVAGRTELHETRMEGDMARMRQVESLAIPSNGTVKAEPGGLHLMLMDLKQTLEVGQRVPVTLTFKRAGNIKVTAVVEDATKRVSDDHAHH
jgi:copper(I)-binding protein